MRWPTYKGGLIDPKNPQPSQTETRSLALLSWHPSPASRNLADGGKNTPGDPAQTLDDVCDPPVLPSRNIALGVTALKQGLGKVKLTPEGAGDPPLPSWFKISGTETGSGKSYSNLIDLMNTQGRTVYPGSVVNFSPAQNVPGEPKAFKGAYEVPYIANQNAFEKTLQFDGIIAPYITAPALTLAVWNKGDRSSVPSTQCDSFTDLRPGTRLPNPLVRNGWSYVSLSVPPQAVQAVDKYPAGAPDGKAELWGLGGIGVTFPAPVDSVTVDLVQWEQVVTLRAFNASSGLIAQVVSQNTSNVPQKITLNGPGIVRVTASMGATAGGGDFVIRQVCVATLKDPPPPGMPFVTGVEENTTAQVTWPGSLVMTTPGPSGGTLQIYRYLPNQAKTWKSFRIAQFDGSHLLILGLSGVSWIQKSLSDQNEHAKGDIKGNINNNGNPANNNTEKHALLQPGSTYEIYAECEWAGWMRSDSQQSPPSMAEVTWKPFSGPVPVYQFHVTKEVLPDTSMPLPPPSFNDETVFDPRSLQRYLIGFEPDGGLPHFLDDPVKVRFSVDYIDRLLEVYKRKLVFKVRRTDPPAGTLADANVQFKVPPDLQISTSMEDLDASYVPASDSWWVDPSQLAPCITGKGKVGTQAEIKVALEPDAEYDILLMAAPDGDLSSDQILIARAHFRTSKYKNPTEMLRALGFDATVNPIRAHDLLLENAPGQQNFSPFLLQRDRDLEEALRTLALDPLPVPSAPRVSLVWSPSGQSYLLTGAVIDLDEPTYREARMSPSDLRVLRPNQPPMVFSLLRSNETGTRLLYWLGTAASPPAGSTLVCEFHDKNGKVSGTRIAGSTPRALYEEDAQ